MESHSRIFILYQPLVSATINADESLGAIIENIGAGFGRSLESLGFGQNLGVKARAKEGNPLNDFYLYR